MNFSFHEGQTKQDFKDFPQNFFQTLTLSLTGVGPFGPSLTNMQIALKVLKVRYRQKLGIPQAGS